jgi:hypothetical protein
VVSRACGRDREACRQPVRRRIQQFRGAQLRAKLSGFVGSPLRAAGAGRGIPLLGDEPMVRLEIAWGAATARCRALNARRKWRPRACLRGGQPPSTIQCAISRQELASAFRACFRVETVLGYPVLIPPPYLAARFPRGPARLSSLERRVHAWPGFRSLGDHFLLVLRRRDDRGEHRRGRPRT